MSSYRMRYQMTPGGLLFYEQPDELANPIHLAFVPDGQLSVYDDEIQALAALATFYIDRVNGIPTDTSYIEFPVTDKTTELIGKIQHGASNV